MIGAVLSYLMKKPQVIRPGAIHAATGAFTITAYVVRIVRATAV